jgi:thioester reductase-like protein
LNYFVTGATGMIDSFLIEKLAAGRGQVYVLIRESSRNKFHALKARIEATDAERIIPVYGDVTQPCLDLSANDVAVLKGNVDHFLHFTAVADTRDDSVYSMAANQANIAHAVQAAEAMQAGCFHHICSAALNELFKCLIQEPLPEETQLPVYPEHHSHLSH